MITRGPLWKVCVRTTPEAEEAVTELLQSSFQQSPSSYTNVETGDVTVAVYLSGKKQQPAVTLQDASALKNALRDIQHCGLNIGSGKVSVQKIRREHWAESWKRHFKPIEIGAALLIKPGWSKRRAKKGQAIVILDPGLSFGTGQHPTTAFCLQALVRHFELRVSGFESRKPSHRTNPKSKTRNSQPSFLDIGTGSGILAIAAAKLGFDPVEAFDFDPDAVRIARENARKNSVSPKVHIRREDVTIIPPHSRKKYDLICANLISTLLIVERRRILSRLKNDGTLVLAGILKNEFPSIQRAYEASGLRLIASRTEREWRSGAFTMS